MFAQLGNTQFENLKTFDDYNKTGSAVYAEHALLDNEPRLQFTGRTLNDISLSIRLHVSFCKPKDELKVLRDAKNNGEVLPLLWGNGDVEGDFVITQLEEEIEHADPQGNVFSYLVKLDLKEYVNKDKLQQEQQTNRDNAKAVGNKKPVVKKKTNPVTCAQTIQRIVSSIESHYAVINGVVLQRGGLATLSNKNTVTSHLMAMKKLAEDLMKRAEDPNSCANAYPDIDYRAKQIPIAVDNWNYDLTNRGTGTSPAQNKILGACVRNLKTAAQPLTTQAITRKG